MIKVESFELLSNKFKSDTKYTKYPQQKKKKRRIQIKEKEKEKKMNDL